MKPTKKNKQKVLEFFNAIDFMFDLNNFDKSVEFSEDTKQNKHGITQADIYFDYSYRILHVTIYPEYWYASQEDQRKVLLHELCHSITAQITLCAEKLLDGVVVTKDMVSKENERTTSQIAHILDRLLSGNLTYAKEAYKEYLQ